MNKAFVKENTEQPEQDEPAQSRSALPAGAKNYITPAGHASLHAELKTLLEEERPRIVDTVHWAAKNGDRSENGDYLYGKKRLREIDRRVRFLTKRLEIAQVVDASVHHGKDQVFFGASVDYETEDGQQHSVTIVGIDEADSLQQRISWISPVARALLKARIDDEVLLHTPSGPQRLLVLDVRYPAPGN
ncbi:transcription elongation factor GreB [Vandammella animalimorsus]|uniref:Transcription elongation factor GreB n=1 Tax=Vandammella animalimorsus TaxID=2029117 RepID=A0A2A2T8N3_9BURK|nr:transcription elongation factor GreB [Vandammella animalimorsus]PAT33492.1 transcription elongation factor GreB [Vandammella animalimorsus]PAX18400.1 transcription elongation factor GreB [Vandammella animalimorsus]PAX20564.1 transcription elongation factor GreB [Vandammella animalimorsus]